MTDKNISWQKSRQYTEEQLHTAAVVLEEIRSGTDTMKAVRAHPLSEGGYIAKHMLVHVYRQKVKNGDLEVDDGLLARIRMKPIRSLSGVSTVTVLTKPHPCPGNCLFCPDDSQLPKSYLLEEPGRSRPGHAPDLGLPRGEPWAAQLACSTPHPGPRHHHLRL